ncbi:kynureninase [Aliiglaciecola sp. LCG003]|uniref:kynureninase n=1 Tax=Aliiglaciecola sp. LCG003 TaxID=3053655 RepID=UPI00257317C7|nr:kynureninase [Aliiglaciecola sp. LCG003]WJG10318.1 kynureninase [Aliiglaciecola sp. LCG003]
MTVENSDMQLQANQLDAADPLRMIKDDFDLPEDTIYLDGNSLGALPKIARQRAREVVEQQWGRDLITSWNKHQWIDLPRKVGESIGGLIGAEPGQTICCDSISVNLFKLLSGALMMQRGRHKVVSQADNFPTDLYMVQGLQGLLGAAKCQLELVEENAIEASLSENVAVLLLTHVNFRSGVIHDMQRLTKLAHDKGILVIWDLAHSAGVLDLHLDDCEADFALGCGYKYLNGGPGAPAFIYIAQRHQDAFQQPLTGWMGHKTPFSFSADYHAAEGMNQCLSGTPAILSMSVLDAALSIFTKTSMSAIREKSVQLGDFFVQCLHHYNLFDLFTAASPMNAQERGSQFALAHPDAYAICQALIGHGVIGDFRSPDILRLGFAPLYVSFCDVHNATLILADIMQQKIYTQARFQARLSVT